jgi:galactoside O-acetyltransferase
MTNQAYQLNFKNIGQDVTIWERSKIINSEVISLGNSVIIDDFVFLMGGKKTIIGSFVHIAAFTSIAGGGELIMDDFTTLSHGVHLFTGNDNYLGEHLPNSTIPSLFRQPERSFVRLNKHVIIGASSVILPGVDIGEGVAIGANSLVKEDCEPWTVYGGSPAKVIKTRPKEKILELEQQLRNKVYDENGNYIIKKYWNF